MFGFFNRQQRPEQFKAIIIGAGEVGYHLAQRLAAEHKRVVIIDKNADMLRHLSEHLDVQTIHGSGCSPRVLQEAGGNEADIFLAVTDSDEVNLVACLFAGLIAPQATKLARIRNEEYIEHQAAFTKQPVNVNKIINPEAELVHALDRMLTMPGATDYNEFADGKLAMAGIHLEEGPLVGTQLLQFREIAQDDGLRVAAIVRQGRVIVPYGTDTIEAGDIVYFIFTPRSRGTIRRISATTQESVHNILIIGGGNIGLRLARHFEDRGYHVKLMEKDEERCQVLAEKLNSTLVLLGDGTSKDDLQEENAGSMDLVVALTANDETNILVCLLARSLGARRTVSRVNKSAYFSLARATGIDHCISPRLAAVNTALGYIRKGRVLASVSIEEDAAEILEAEALANSSIVGTPLRKLSFPRGASLLAVVRGDEVIIPGGDTVVQPDDRILILAQRQSMGAVEASLMVKLHSV